MMQSDERGPETRTCGTIEAHLRLLDRDPRYRAAYEANQRFTAMYLNRYADAGARSFVVTIPVVVHVIHNDAAHNVSDAVVQSQIDRLNLDYRRTNTDLGSVPGVFAPLEADMRIQFALARRDPNCATTTGITRTSTTVPQFDIFDDVGEPVKSAATGGADPWPADKYLNIWVCKGMPTQLGRATFPGTSAAHDGVIIVTEAFGTIGTILFSHFNLGRTATHEIGHYFNLHHPWGDSLTGSNPTCTLDDFVSDTPIIAGPNTGCPAFPHVTCSNGPNGDMFMNYMDYADDPCMLMFTLGQAARAEAALAGPRASLQASDGLVPPPAPDVADLWSADTPDDTGAEPDPSTAVMYQSDDIWVRNQADGTTNTEHQNPLFDSSGATHNVVYVRVRNRACGASAASGTLKLYWAKASSSLGWPAPWDGSVTLPPVMGGLIGTQPTGSVAGRASTILAFPWNPPNPADYSSFGGDRNHFCLLSRIETSATSPFGMTFPETGDLWANVQNNNNIVWKNVEVHTPGGGRTTSAVTIGNHLDEQREVVLQFGLKGGDAIVVGREGWDVVAQLPPDLLKAAVDKNAFEQLDGGALRVLGAGAQLGPIVLGAREYHTIQLEFTASESVGDGVYYFDVTQFDKGADRPTGGQRIVVKKLPAKKRLPGGITGTWFHSYEEDEPDRHVYRRSDYEFPPARGRNGFTFEDEGAFVSHDIAAADGIEKHEGFWTGEDDTRVRVAFHDPKHESFWLEILEVGRDILKLRF